MGKSLLLLIFIHFFVAPSVGLADRVTNDPVIHPTKSVRPKNTSEARKRKIANTLQSVLATMQGTTVAPYTQKDIEDMNTDYQRMVADPNHEEIRSLPGPFDQTTKECGEKAQRECAPERMGGRTMCGRAVSQMIACLAPSIGGSSACTGKCGNGKDFVNCTPSNQMDACGYQKLRPGDVRCKMPGAVLAYHSSPTTRGKLYGHVEFICGRGQYCSVYKQPNSQPWPNKVPDACWYPRAGTTQEAP